PTPHRDGGRSASGVQLLRPAAHPPHLRHHLRQRARVHGRLAREGAADHHQLYFLLLLFSSPAASLQPSTSSSPEASLQPCIPSPEAFIEATIPSPEAFVEATWTASPRRSLP